MKITDSETSWEINLPEMDEFGYRETFMNYRTLARDPSLSPYAPILDKVAEAASSIYLYGFSNEVFEREGSRLLEEMSSAVSTARGTMKGREKYGGPPLAPEEWARVKEFQKQFSELHKEAVRSVPIFPSCVREKDDGRRKRESLLNDGETLPFPAPLKKKIRLTPR